MPGRLISSDKRWFHLIIIFFFTALWNILQIPSYWYECGNSCTGSPSMLASTLPSALPWAAHRPTFTQACTGTDTHVCWHTPNTQAPTDAAVHGHTHRSRHVHHSEGASSLGSRLRLRSECKNSSGWGGGVWVWFLVRELRSCMAHYVAKILKTNKKQQLSPCLIPQWGHHRKGPPDWVPFSGILFINGPHVPAPDLGTRDRERKRSCR